MSETEGEKIITLRSAILALLTHVGDIGKCRGCGREIYWVKHKNGKVAPYTEEGLNHFIDCPDREKFRKERG